MNIFNDTRRFYDESGISAANFHCKHLVKCMGSCGDFTEAREAFIGREYESGTLPRLLFLSLDSGDGDPEPQKRTLEACRGWEENECKVDVLPKTRHWYRTHELALLLLQAFKPGLSLSEVHAYFAHTNSAKCSMNKAGRRMADWHLFKNCREYIPGEFIALRPDILVTQGEMAKVAVQGSFPSRVNSASIGGDNNIINIQGRNVLWIHTYHPSYYGGFNRQRRECFTNWAEDVKRFVADEPKD